MKQTVLALALGVALGLALGLLPMETPAGGLTAHPKLTVQVADLDALRLPETSLRLCSWERVKKGREWVYTKQAAPQETAFAALYALPRGVSLTVADAQGGPLSSKLVRLYAWSDPDGDGIFDARLECCGAEGGELLPVAGKGPLFGGPVGGRGGWYSDTWYILNDGGLTACGEPFDVAERFSLSSDDLTEKFGANTLLEIQLCAYDEKPCSFVFLLTGERVDSGLVEGS